MRIKLDENLPEGPADLLRSAKYDVATLLEEGGRLVESGLLERLQGGPCSKL